MKKIFLLLATILLTATAHSVSLDSINTNPENLGLHTKFSIQASLSGNTCGAEVRFYINESLISSKTLSCDKVTAESKTIDPVRENLWCGKHKIRVELLDRGVGVMNASMDLFIGDEPIVNVTGNPVPDKETPIVFLNPKTYSPLENLKVEIYNTKKGEDKAQTYHTDASGTLFFKTNEVGEYRYLIDDGEYCGSGSFYVKKTLNYDGPHPRNPMVGERISLAVPQGVGIKIINSSGDVYLTAFTSLGGGVNFSINESGNYTISMGEMSSYWCKNISLTVYGKENTVIRVSPEKIVRGREVVIEVVAGGTSLGNARLVIEDPLKQKKEYTTNESGQLLYTPETAGKYSVVFEGERYERSEQVFEAKNIFLLDYSPKNPRVDREITVFVRDGLNNLVPAATVSVADTVYGLSGVDGRYVFKVERAGRYVISASKEGFYDSSIEVIVSSPLRLEAKPHEVEVGGDVFIKTYDEQGKEVESKITITKPSGKEVYGEMPYTPDEAGIYEVSAEREGYIPSKINFTVKPRPLELSLALIKDRLIINTTSRNTPVAGISILVEKETGKEVIVTNQYGSAETRIEKSGIIKITANPNTENPLYGKISVVRNVVRKHDTTSLLVALSVISFIALIAVALIYFTPRRDEPPKKNIKPYFSENKKEGVGRRPRLSG